jgi:hypothetical protein
MPWTRLSEDERAAVRALRYELKELVSCPPSPPKRSEAPVPPSPSLDHGALGLYRKNNTWTHTLGDEHAARILSGEIPRDKALADERARQRYLAEMRR